MRVLQVYNGKLYGGIEKLLSTLAIASQSEVSRHFALCFQGRLHEELVQSNAALHDLGAVRISRPWTVLRSRNRLSQLHRQFQFDVVITHACWIHAVLAPRIRKLKIPLVNWVHDGLKGRHFTERLAKLTPPDLLIVNSFFSQAAARSVFPNTPSEVLYHPLSPPARKMSESERMGMRLELKTPLNSKVILQASRLERWKGHLSLLNALSKIKGRDDWTCWIAGGPQRPHEHAYFSEMKSLAKHLRIEDRVRFLGQRLDVPELMQASDVFCQPNTGPEPFGVVFIEALYAGLPVVATSIGGPLEIITPEVGRMVEPNNPNAVASALVEILCDDALRSSLAHHAPIRASDLCGINSQLLKLDKLLRNVTLRQHPAATEIR